MCHRQLESAWMTLLPRHSSNIRKNVTGLLPHFCCHAVGRSPLKFLFYYMKNRTTLQVQIVSSSGMEVLKPSPRRKANINSTCCTFSDAIK